MYRRACLPPAYPMGRARQAIALRLQPPKRKTAKQPIALRILPTRLCRRRRSPSRPRRSEERRVGKECRSRWSPYHEKKKREVRRFPVRYKIPASSGRRFPVGGELPNCATFAAFVSVLYHPRLLDLLFFFFSSRRRHTRLQGDWSSDVCSSD